MPATLAIDPVKAATPLADVVESPRALKALEAAGCKTLGDAAEKGYDALSRVRYVGESTLALIRRAVGPLPEREPEDPGEIEEGSHPIRCECGYPAFKIRLAPAHRIVLPEGGYAVQEPMYLEFDRGHAALDKRTYLMVIHRRDRTRVDEGMKNGNLPWRKDAADWLQSLNSFRNGTCRILFG